MGAWVTRLRAAAAGLVRQTRQSGAAVTDSVCALDGSDDQGPFYEFELALDTLTPLPKKVA